MSNEATANALPGALKPGKYLFPGIAGGLLVCVVLGFAPTFFLRPFMDVTAIPWHVHLHGLVLTGWYVLFLFQSMLIATGRVGIHRKIGITGLFVGLAVVATSIVVVSEIVDRVDVAFSGDPGEASEVIWGSFARILGFTTFLAIALAYRRNREIHRRAIVVASIAIIQPAIGRFAFGLLPPGSLSGYLLMFAIMLSFFVALMVFDLSTRGRPHWVTAIGLLYVT